jgi:hypothetical protein
LDFSYRENYNDLLDIEWMGGDLEMMEEEYKEGHYHCEDLCPERGGRYFWARTMGAGYVHLTNSFLACVSGNGDFPAAAV